MNTETVMIYLDLLMDNGELVRIECPDKYTDDFFESIENAIKRGDRWSTNQFDGCRAYYMGVLIERISMKRVMGEL